MNYIFLDLETTGLHPEKGDVIIDVGAIKCDGTGITEEFQSYISPGDREVSDFVYRLTHTTPELLANAPAAEEVIEKLKIFLGNEYVLVGHNIAFDANFLSYYGISIGEDQLLDTNDFATLFIPDAPSHSLEVLSEYLGLPHVGKHTAMGDVMASYHLMGYMKQRYEEKLEWADEFEDVAKKIPAWGGNYFRMLPSSMFTVTYPIPEKNTEIVCDEECDLTKNHSILSPGSHEESILMESFKEIRDGVLLVPEKKMSLFASYAKGHPHSSIMIHSRKYGAMAVDKMKDYVHSETIPNIEAMLYLRCKILLATIGKEMDSIPMYLLHLTHRERRVVSKLLDDDIHWSLPLITSYKEYYKNNLKETLPNHHLYLYEGDGAEIHAVKTGTSIIFEGYIQAKLQYLKELFQDKSKEAVMDVESLSRVIYYFFQNVTKIGSSLNTQYVRRDQMGELLDSLSSSLPKALEILEEHARLQDVELPVLKHLKELCIMLYEETEGSYYAYIYNNEAKIFIEAPTIEENYLQMQDAHTIDSAYLLHPSWDKLEKSTQIEVSLDTRELREALDMDKKTIVVGSKTSELERAFDHFYESYQSDDFRVLMMGKSGGTGKVEYMFSQAKSGILFIRTDDFLNLTWMMAHEGVMIMHLPFPVFTEQYFQKKYGRSTFTDVTLPVLTHNLVNIIEKSGRLTTGSFNISILDSRLWEKDYCKDVLRTLEERFQVSKKTRT